MSVAPMDDSMKPPKVSAMDKLGAVDTVICRQMTQYFGAITDFQQQNKYEFAIPPENVRAASELAGADVWNPTGGQLRDAPSLFLGYEISSLCTRVLFKYLNCSFKRPLQFNFIPWLAKGELDAQGMGNILQNKDIQDADSFKLVRPFKCGGCCCDPYQLTVHDPDGSSVGKVMENFQPYGEKCNHACCKCTFYHDMFEQESTGFSSEPIYTLRVNECCCGRVNNCCGASCCKTNMIFDILDRNGEIVANIQKTFAKEETGCCGATCRMCSSFSNYIVSFPKGSTLSQKKLILGALMQMEYLYFTPRDKEEDNNAFSSDS